MENEELKRLEETLPKLKGSLLEEVSKLYRAKTGVGCDGIHPAGSPGLDKRDERRVVEILGEGGAEWQMAATILLTDALLDPKNVTSERPIALTPKLIRWWETLRASEVSKW